MKYLIMLLFIATCSNAATMVVTPNPIMTSASFANTPGGSPTFTDDWKFTILQPSDFASSATTISIAGRGFEGLSATLNPATLNVPFDVLRDHNGAWTLALTYSNLAAGDHTLRLNGVNQYGSSYGGNITITHTPVSAAVWLFGSALLSLVGLSDRRRNVINY
jgi:hypothetical protein